MILFASLELEKRVLNVKLIILVFGWVLGLNLNLDKNTLSEWVITIRIVYTPY